MRIEGGRRRRVEPVVRQQQIRDRAHGDGRSPRRGRNRSRENADREHGRSRRRRPEES